jgi:hypothetical protein
MRGITEFCVPRKFLSKGANMPEQRKSGAAGDLLKDQEVTSGEAGKRSGKAGKSGGGMGGQQAGGIKGGGKPKTHAGNKKGSPGGLTSD